MLQRQGLDRRNSRLAPSAGCAVRLRDDGDNFAAANERLQHQRAKARCTHENNPSQWSDVPPAVPISADSLLASRQRAPFYHSGM
jgi:hypothetical protein